MLWANDIDPKCCAIYQLHFGPSSIVCDDVAHVKSTIPPHDILTAGFPCQPFSSAGKKNGVRDNVRGTLFAEIVEVLEGLRPEFFILENVKRLLTMEDGHHFKTILYALTSASYVVEWRLLNAQNFGLAQNRERIFIIGQKDPSFLHCDPDTFLRNHAVLLLSGDLRESLLPFASLADLMRPIHSHRHGFATCGFAFGGNVFSFEPPSMPPQRPFRFLRDVLEREVDPRFDFTDVTNGWVKKNTEVNSFIHGVEVISNQEGGRRMGYTIFGDGGVAPTLTATPSRHYERYRINGRYRRLTNVEYARLQGFPDNWCSAVTVYDQYGLFGNAVPPPMVEWVAKRLVARVKDKPEGCSNGGHKGATAAARP